MDSYIGQTSIISTGCLKPIIKLFDSGWNYILHIPFKLISLLVIWSWKCNNVLKKKITSLRTSVIRVCQSRLNIFLQWISKTCIRKYKNHSKAISGAERFAQNLRACKTSRCNIWNCKFRRHIQRHTFRRHNSQYKPSLTNILYYSLKVKRRKNRKTKSPSPCQQNWMLHVIKHRLNTSLWNSIIMIPPFLPFNEPNLCTDYIFMDWEYNNRLCFLNQVDSNSDPLDNMILQQVVMHPTKNQIFYTNKDMKNCTFINVGTSISIVTWKRTKNHSHIISDRPLSSCSSYYESNQRFKRNDESSCLPIIN